MSRAPAFVGILGGNGKNGGQVILSHKVTGIEVEGETIRGLHVLDTLTNEKLFFKGDYVFSSMPRNDYHEKQ